MISKLRIYKRPLNVTLSIFDYTIALNLWSFILLGDGGILGFKTKIRLRSRGSGSMII